MTSGAIVLKESELYSVKEMAVLCSFMLISVLGVVFLVNKIPIINKAVMALPGINTI